MRRLATMMLLAALALGARALPASAHAFGQNIPAGPLRGGNNLFSVDLLLGDQVDNAGVLGQVRFKSSDQFDWGLQLGFSDAGSGAVLIGGDLRPLITSSTGDMPLDVDADIPLGLTIGDSYTIVQVVPALEVSHRFPLNGTTQALSPYGGIGLDINHVSVDNVGSDTNLDVVARFGLEWEAARKLAVTAEFGVGNHQDDFNLGVNVPF